MKKQLLIIVNLLLILLINNNVNSQSTVVGWKEVNITSNDLIKSSCINIDTMLFVSDSNLLFKSIDNGETWKSMDVFSNVVNCIKYNLDNNTIYAVGENTYLTKSIDCGETWKTVDMSLGLENESLSSIYFNDNDFYLTSANTSESNLVNLVITKSGSQWTTNANFTNKYFSDIYFIDDQIGYLLNVSDGQPTLLYKTEDNGMSWTIKNTGINFWGNSIFYCHEDTLNIVTRDSFLSGHPMSLQLNDTTWKIINISDSLYFHNYNYYYNKDCIFMITNNSFNLFVIDIHNYNNIYNYKNILSKVKPLSFSSGSLNKSLLLSNENSNLFTLNGGNDLTITTENVEIYCNQLDTLSVDVIYNGTNDLTYTWEPDTCIITNNLSYVIIDPTVDTTYYITVSDGFITITDSIKITITPELDTIYTTYTIQTTDTTYTFDTIHTTYTIQTVDVLDTIQTTDTTYIFDTMYIIDTIQTVDTTYTFDSITIENTVNIIDSINIINSIHILNTMYIMDTIYIPKMTSINRTNSIDFKMYPNPATNQIHLDIPNSSITAINIIDVAGQIVYSSITSNNSETINIEELNSGIYILNIQNENGIGNTKLIKR